jgi:hypothetical protein
MAWAHVDDSHVQTPCKYLLSWSTTKPKQRWSISLGTESGLGKLVVASLISGIGEGLV